SLESNTQLTALTSISVLLRRSQEEVIFFTEDVGNFYELNSLYLTLSRKLTSKLEANLSSYYQLQDYPASNAEEEIKDFSTWGFRTALKYNIQKWLSADLSYWHEDRSSDFGRKKNVIAFTINAVF
ncbi:MAG: polysaccharide biosynthesis protein VpsM, partial [Planctomycetota bacterium]|nr:polysaccharide biosynthesis protein VpsM [Planctomycetota bacterium]